MRTASARNNVHYLPQRQSRQTPRRDHYSAFDQINGEHPWRQAAPDGFVDYGARILRDSKVVYFNFALAKEMGLLPADHGQTLNPRLEKKLVETFALQIINEYDIETGARCDPDDVKPGKYMATRYLQTQHPGRTGMTSGDGRSIWNGLFVGNGFHWDVSSCGTGATCLSPHFARTKKPVRTGDPRAHYGSGLAEIDEGLSAAIMSEIFHSRGIHTERTLAVIEGPRGNAVNVRAAKNLLRPSHLFLPLKQNDREGLRSAVDYYIERQIANGEWEGRKSAPEKYDDLLRDVALRYARFSARMEDEYIFCWMEWDGDNVLASGGIIDYGSIRQFGLFHHRYRYDDVERFSTNIKEQKSKARYLVQTFAQMVDWLKTAQFRELRRYRNSPCLKLFDSEFESLKIRLMLRRLGLSTRQQDKLLLEDRSLAKAFHEAYAYFERKGAAGGYRRVPDGINWPAAYSIRNLVKELPNTYLQREGLAGAREFLHLLKSPYASGRLLRPSGRQRARAREFQTRYWALLTKIAGKRSLKRALLELTMRASVANATPVTGDAVIHVVDALIGSRKDFSPDQFIRLVDRFIDKHCGERKGFASEKKPTEREQQSGLTALAEQTLYALLDLVEAHRHTI